MSETTCVSLMQLDFPENDTDLKLRDTAFNFDKVEFEIISPINFNDPLQLEIYNGLADIDARLESINQKIEELNGDIEKFTNNADGLDYTIAIASGVLTGLLDAFVIGEFDFKGAKEKSNKAVNEFIMKYAKKKGYDGDRLNGAIEFLEKKYKVPFDNAWKGKDIGTSASNHHLNDLAHHPTLLGLFASILAQFFNIAVFANKDGNINILKLDLDTKELVKAWLPIIASGLLIWISNVAEKYCEEKLDTEIPKPIRGLIKLLASSPAIIEIVKVAANWFGHLVSDMGGSKNTAGGGKGIPGIFLSLLKELSCLPILKDTKLPQIVNDLYKNGFDLRSELAVVMELGRQAIPVLLNELIVRLFYFIRRLIVEYKTNGGFDSINWKNVIPFGNRTVERMMTIATGTFTAVDAADAAIRAIAQNGFTPAAIPAFAMRVNFVGVGRFVIAIGTDIGMGMKKNKKERERLMVNCEKLQLLNAKVYYKQANMWIAAEQTAETISETYVLMNTAALEFFNVWQELVESQKVIAAGIENIKKKDPDFAEELRKQLKWGI